MRWEACYAWVEGNVVNQVDPSGMDMCGVPITLIQPIGGCTDYCKASRFSKWVFGEFGYPPDDRLYECNRRYDDANMISAENSIKRATVLVKFQVLQPQTGGKSSVIIPIRWVTWIWEH